MNTERAPASALDDILSQAAAAGAEAVISGMGDLVSAPRARCGNLG